MRFSEKFDKSKIFLPVVTKILKKASRFTVDRANRQGPGGMGAKNDKIPKSGVWQLLARQHLEDERKGLSIPYSIYFAMIPVSFHTRGLR